MLRTDVLIRIVVFLALGLSGEANAIESPPAIQERITEWTIESRKSYADPFNEVEVDVVFRKDGQSWRVPTFWRGGQRWTVRFAPPTPGEYTYYLQSTDPGNHDLNGHEGKITIAAYQGSNNLLRHGTFRVSANKRYLEHADGTPFYWLGDTWWTGLSDRLSWEGFQKLTTDRKTKGFTVVQIVGGLIPSNEEQAPVDPGFRNEGGAVWDREFKRINPMYFDYADRRIQHLVEAGIAPAIVGGWNQVLVEMGVARMKKHWRYLIARYGAYPVFWILGGEVMDPPLKARDSLTSQTGTKTIPGGWTDVARYVRAIDPYRHPFSVHEAPPPLDTPLQDAWLTDFDLPQPSHFGWPSLAAEVVQLTSRYARTNPKPVVQGEIGYEQIGGQHLQDFQRAAFWLAMLNGAAGHTYGAIETAEAYTADKPLHRVRWSLFTWEEAMNFPGAAQVALSANLLRQFPWQRFAPHPEWITPRGTTLLEPNDSGRAGESDLLRAFLSLLDKSPLPAEHEIPTGEWKKLNGSFRHAYAAGVPGEVRIIYIPYFGLLSPSPPTVFHLEPGLSYNAYFWDPVLGIKVDLGTVQQPALGTIIYRDTVRNRKTGAWVDHASDSVFLLKGVKELNVVTTLSTVADAEAAIFLRYHDRNNYVAAIYSGADRTISLRQRVNGEDQLPLGKTAAPVASRAIKLTAELRDAFGIVSVTDGNDTFTSPIVSFTHDFDPPMSKRINTLPLAGCVGVMHQNSSATFGDFEVRKSPTLVEDNDLQRKLYDARGVYRGEISGTPNWDNFAKTKPILLDAYRPERFPFRQDWVLVLQVAPEKRDNPMGAAQGGRSLN